MNIYCINSKDIQTGDLLECVNYTTYKREYREVLEVNHQDNTVMLKSSINGHAGYHVTGRVFVKTRCEPVYILPCQYRNDIVQPIGK